MMMPMFNVQAFGKHVHDEQGVSLDFPTIGKLTAKFSKVCVDRVSEQFVFFVLHIAQLKFRFYREFLEQPGPAVRCCCMPRAWLMTDSLARPTPRPAATLPPALRPPARLTLEPSLRTPHHSREA